MRRCHLLLLVRCFACVAAQRPLQPTALSAGRDSSCAILEDASVKCWGRNKDIPLGYPDTNNRGDQRGEMGNVLGNISLGIGRRPMMISNGGYHRCVLLDNGGVKCWGAGGSGQLGYNNNTNIGALPGDMGDNLPFVDLGTGRTVLQVACGDYHTCAILDDRSLKCWGDNSRGQLGLGDTTNRGDMLGTMGSNLPAVSIGTGRTVLGVTTGDYHTCVLMDNGMVKCWGDGQDGELGYGDIIRRGDDPFEMGDNLPTVNLGTGVYAVKVAAGWYHTCALLAQGAVKCWGYNAYGQLGLGDAKRRGNNIAQMGDYLPTVDLGTKRKAVDISLGVDYTCALLSTGELKCWGQGTYGQLASGEYSHRGDDPGEMGDSLPMLTLGLSSDGSKILRVMIMDCGDLHACALLEDGRTKCWGYNLFGQLGIGTNYTFGNTPFTIREKLPPTNLGDAVQDNAPPPPTVTRAQLPGLTTATTSTSTAAPSPSPWVLLGASARTQLRWPALLMVVLAALPAAAWAERGE